MRVARGLQNKVLEAMAMRKPILATSAAMEGIQNFVDGKKPLYAPITGKAITVSPYDVELACYCEHCRKLWDDEGGQYGGDNV